MEIMNIFMFYSANRFYTEITPMFLFSIVFAYFLILLYYIWSILNILYQKNYLQYQNISRRAHY